MRLPLLVILFFGFTIGATRLPAQTDQVTNAYRVTLSPYHPITQNLTGFGYLGYETNPQNDYSLYYLGYPGISYRVKPWLQIWTRLTGIYTNNHGNGKEDTFELRPFVGPKFFLLNRRKMNLFNFTLIMHGNRKHSTP